MFIQYPLSLFRPDLYRTNETGVDSCTCRSAPLTFIYLIWPLCTPCTFPSLSRSLPAHDAPFCFILDNRICNPFFGPWLTHHSIFKVAPTACPITTKCIVHTTAHSISPSCSAAALKREARMQDCAPSLPSPSRRALCLPTAMDSLFASANYRSFFRH